MNRNSETTKVYIEKYLKDFGKQSTVYNAIVEAVTNAIDSIEAKRKIDNEYAGNIRIVITRKEQLPLNDGVNSEIEKIEIHDDGIGFTNENRDSFNTLYSPQKQNNGGKGLGRMFYIKYFQNVSVESVFLEEKLKSRFFRFGKNYDIVEDERVKELDEVMPTGAKVIMSGYCGASKSFHDSTETFAHRVLEKILNYFVVDDFKCPIIVIQDRESSIVLNDQVGDSCQSKISLVDSGSISIPCDSISEVFGFKVFKIKKVYNQISRIILTANNKAVTDVKLEDYIPEFAEDFEEDVGDGKPQKYVLRYYVYGKYLDENVNNERTGFYFGESPDLEHPLGQRDIESAVASEAKSKMQNEVTTRFQKKKEDFRNYADQNIWYKDYLSEIDFEKVKINPSKDEIEAEFHRVKYKTDLARRNKAENILNTMEIKGENLPQVIGELSKELTATDKSNLAQYMIFRKAALSLFEKALSWNESEIHEKEKLLHDIIFPTRKDSSDVDNEGHNLWLIDESLSFTQYLSSDKKRFTESSDRPDIAAFYYPISYREGDTPSCPITIFEFKRPGRTDFINSSNDEDPVEQIVRYVIQFKDGKLKQPNGFNIEVAPTTPFYGYIVASADNIVKKWLVEEKNMTVTPDGEGWFLDRDKINLRIEFITWEKLLRDAKIRHKTFFDKLGLKV